MTQITIKDLKCNWKKYNSSDFSAFSDRDNATLLFKLKFEDHISHINQLISVLNPEELERASHYHRLVDENRFIISRAYLKLLLAKFSGLEPRKLVFDKRKNHKPFLSNNPSITFNISHTTAFGLIAVGIKELGVDIEFIDKTYEYQLVMPRILNETEIGLVSDSPLPIKTFFQYWTRKEALVKASGLGINDLIINVPAQIGNHTVPQPVLDRLGDMKVLTFDVGEDHIGSLAYSPSKIGVDNIHFYHIDYPFG